MTDIELAASLINKRKWWHVPPFDPNAYAKRGKFYSSTFREAEFYGRPNDVPDRVRVRRPVIGDEVTIETTLFGEYLSGSLPNGSRAGKAIEARLALDGKMKRTALRMGYDSIVLMTPDGFAKFRETGRLPRSIELNVLKPSEPTFEASADLGGRQ